MKNKINLPKVYEIKENTPKKFYKHEGKPKLSQSQMSSFNDPLYHYNYVLQYILGQPSKDNFFATFGSYCGNAIEYRMQIDNAEGEEKEFLEEAFKYFNETDVQVLKEVDAKLPEDSVYEREVVLDLGELVVQGFLDVNFSRDGAYVLDVKTGSKNSKKKGIDYYSSQDRYTQTTLYCKALIEEGEEIEYSGVIFLDRKMEGKFEDPILHLSGEVIKVPTPYDEKVAQKVIKGIKSTALAISSLKTTADKLKQLMITI